YRLHWKRGFPDAIKHPSNYVTTEPVAYLAADWDVQRDIFVRHAMLTLHPFWGGVLQFNFVGFGDHPAFDRQADGSIRLELQNVAAYSEEEAAPPEANLRAHVGVYYTYGFVDPNYYWSARGKRSADEAANFIKKSNQARNEVRRLILPSDSNEQ